MAIEAPVNKLPPMVIALTLLIVGIEALFQLANQGVFELVTEQGAYSFDLLKRFVTYPFINNALTQVAFCAALTLALGKFVGEYFGGLRVLIIYVFASIAGAVAYGFFASGTYPLFGGFTPVYGLIGAYTYALWLRLRVSLADLVFLCCWPLADGPVLWPGCANGLSVLGLVGFRPTGTRRSSARSRNNC